MFVAWILLFILRWNTFQEIKHYIKHQNCVGYILSVLVIFNNILKSNAFSTPGRFPLYHPRLYFCKAQINGKSERHGKSFKVRMGEKNKRMDWKNISFLFALRKIFDSEKTCFLSTKLLSTIMLSFLIAYCYFDN